MLEQFFEHLDKTRADMLSRNGAKWPRNNPVASDISNCTRETALGVLHWQDRPDFGVDLLARLDAGKDYENIAYRKMMAMGIEITEQQRSFELKDKQGRTLSRGKIDGKITIPPQFINNKRMPPVPFDLKTMHPSLFDRFDTVEDLLANPFFSKYPKQLMTYEYMNDIDTGFLWIENMLGKMKFIEVPMDWNLMEKILKQLETAVEAIDLIKKGAATEDEALPPHTLDSYACLKCWAFKRVCMPPLFLGEGMRKVNDPELADKIRRRYELDKLASEYDKLDKEIKSTLKEAMKAEDNWIIGDFLVSAKQKKTRYKAKPAQDAWVNEYLGFDIAPVAEDEAVEKSDEDYKASAPKEVSKPAETSPETAPGEPLANATAESTLTPNQPEPCGNGEAGAANEQQRVELLIYAVEKATSAGDIDDLVLANAELLGRVGVDLNKRLDAARRTRKAQLRRMKAQDQKQQDLGMEV